MRGATIWAHMDPKGDPYMGPYVTNEVSVRGALKVPILPSIIHTLSSLSVFLLMREDRVCMMEGTNMGQVRGAHVGRAPLKGALLRYPSGPSRIP